MQPIEESRELVPLLAELAFLAGGYGMVDRTDAIAGALSELRPASAMPHVIRAAARINRRQLVEAEAILRKEALALEPASDMAKAHLGLALKLQRRAGEAQQLLADVACSKEDPQAAAMAAELMARPLD